MSEWGGSDEGGVGVHSLPELLVLPRGPWTVMGKALPLGAKKQPSGVHRERQREDRTVFRAV